MEGSLDTLSNFLWCPIISNMKLRRINVKLYEITLYDLVILCSFVIIRRNFVLNTVEHRKFEPCGRTF